MHIVFLTLGTRGDVQPYVALGQELVKQGHRATVCTGESFKHFVESHGLQYAHAESDLLAMLETEEGKAVLAGGIKNIRLAMKYSNVVVNPSFRKTLDYFWQACQNADMIIYHPKALAAVDIASKLAIPAVSMPTVPVTYPASEFPCLAVAPVKNYGKALNRLTYKLTEYADISSMKEINDFRQKTLGLPARKAGVYAYKNNGADIPVIVPVSPALFKGVTSWAGRVYLPGFFYLNSEAELLPAKAEVFLTSGAPPVVITFSSMPLKNPARLKAEIEAAVTASGERVVVLTGKSGMAFAENENILCLPAAPHSLLFPRAKGIIHHGGAGTMAQALLAGKPQFVIPFSADQPFWANKLYTLGLTPPPKKEAELTAACIEYIFSMMEEEQYIKAALAFKAEVETDAGVAGAVKYIENLFAQT